MQTNNRKGFTLIELLIVVVIIGILAAIAIPKFANTKEKAYVASMKADLKNLVNVQEGYFADKNTYGAQTDLTGKYSESKGNTLTITKSASGNGWSATAVNPAVTTTGTSTCGIYAGDAATPNAAVTAEGAPACY
jgi:type IV pilus assembly protein PilA